MRIMFGDPVRKDLEVKAESKSKRPRVGSEEEPSAASGEASRKKARLPEKVSQESEKEAKENGIDGMENLLQRVKFVHFEKDGEFDEIKQFRAQIEEL